jgi:hypothetical protein
MHAVVEGATSQCRDVVGLLGGCNSMQTVLMAVHVCAVCLQVQMHDIF